jgi:Flp pilus assembly protein TadD
MVTPRDRTPVLGIAPADPDQLTLGGLDAPASAPPPQAEGGVSEEGDAAVPVREPPVCGEWSFDTEEMSESRAHAVIVPTPALAQPAISVRIDGKDLRRGESIVPVVPPRAPPRPAPRAPAPATPLPALEELKSIHEAHPGDEQTALALSGALSKRGNIEGALGVLQRAIEAGGDGITLRCAKATILSTRLRYDDAEQELRRALKSKPDDPTVLLQQGILACRRAKWRDAVEPLDRVVRNDPLSGQGHFYLGEAMSKLDRLGDALEAYHRAAELEPDNWRAFKGVGMVLDRMGRSGEAAEFYRRARDGQRG